MTKTETLTVEWLVLGLAGVTGFAIAFGSGMRSVYGPPSYRFSVGIVYGCLGAFGSACLVGLIIKIVTALNRSRRDQAATGSREPEFVFPVEPEDPPAPRPEVVAKLVELARAKAKADQKARETGGG